MLEWRANLEQMFGKLSLMWLIPTKPSDRTIDGVNYPYIEENMMDKLFTQTELMNIT